MGRGTICLLVLGLANLLTAAELGLDNIPQSEIKEIEAEIAKGNVPPDYTPSDKAKRGVAKLTNTDNPAFNHLSTSSSSAGATSTVKATTATSQSPYRYLYNNQYYQASPYISYIQSPQAAQIASQYSFQASPLAHYFQTPTQIQYVSTPAIAARYQTVNAKIASSASAAGTAASASQYNVVPAQQIYVSPQSLYQTQSSGTTSHSAASASQYQTPQQLYYPQQPIVMLLVQPQTNPALIYPLQQQQHQQGSYVLGQSPFLGIYNNHRFALPYTTNSQVTYLVPMAVQTGSAQTVKATANDKATSSTSYGVRTTKA